MRKNFIILFLLLLLNSCVGSSTSGIFGTGVSVALDPRTLGTQIDDSIMQKNLQARLALTEKKYLIKISVKVLDGRIFLGGKVDEPEEKLKITKIAWETKGARSVKNNIAIKQKFSFKNVVVDVLITSQLRTALILNKNIKAANFNIDTINQKKDTEDSITTRISKLERESDTLERDLLEIKGKELSLNKILRSFEFDGQIETFDVDPLIQSLDKEHSSLASSLNAIAPQRYVEISTGYRSMSGRKNDLEEERNTIVSFIESIEKDKRQTFLDAFDTVDKEIRGLFNKMNGGNAWLELENEDDIFNSGISYIIQFQNKPKRESTSISGGEKTLAAVVFVLALQKLKPSPFYLFDEIDAHLDAPNAERLANIVEERSNGSQFIMVSLKDSVVQKAKLIYGVYPERGVSKVVIYKDKRIPSISKIAN